MGARWLAVGGVIVATLAATAPDPAGAASSSTTPTVIRTGTGAAFASFSVVEECSGAPEGGYLHVTGPATPPIGVGSLELDNINGVNVPLLADLSSSTTPAADLTRFVVRTDQDAASTVPLHAVVFTSGPTIGFNIAPTGHWSTTNVLTAPSTDGGTWSQFLTENPGVTLETVGLDLEGCNTGTAATVDVDDVEIGINGATTRYDWEPATAPSGKLVDAVNHKTIIAGKSVTLSATLTSGGQPVAGVTVDLLARSAGKATYRQIAAATTNSSGVATGPAQHPSASTSYEWKVPTGADVQSVTSSVTKVAVASAVTVNLSHSPGHLQAVGTVRPAHAGDTVTLWAKSGLHPKKLGSAKLHKDGTYQINASVKPGRYKVFTTAAADSTNAKGTSPTKPVTVR